MKKIICGLAMVAAIGTSALMTGCGGETTVTIKNSLPQEISYYSNDSDEASVKVNITDANVEEIDVTGAALHLKGEVILDNIGYTGGYLINCKVYDEDGEEVETNGITLNADENGIIDDTVSVSLPNETAAYVIELCDYHSTVELD